MPKRPAQMQRARPGFPAQGTRAGDLLGRLSRWCALLAVNQLFRLWGSDSLPTHQIFGRSTFRADLISFQTQFSRLGDKTGRSNRPFLTIF